MRLVGVTRSGCGAIPLSTTATPIPAPVRPVACRAAVLPTAALERSSVPLSCRSQEMRSMLSCDSKVGMMLVGTLTAKPLIELNCPVMVPPRSRTRVSSELGGGP